MLHVPPDTTKIVVDYLTQQADVHALGAGVSTRLPSTWRDTGKWITINPINTGGYRDRIAWADDSHVDVNVWGPDQPTASLIARTARAALMQLANHQYGEGLVTDVKDLGGPGWFPDDSEDPPIPRYIFSISITAHP